MPRKCLVDGCRSGWKTTKAEKAAGLGEYIKSTVFGFPPEASLYRKWIKFVNRDDITPDEKPAETSGVCIKHFEEKYLKRGKNRTDLKLELMPIPTIHTTPEILEKPSLKPNVTLPRKPPTKHQYEHPLLDETPAFIKQDQVLSLEDLTSQCAPAGFSHQHIGGKVVFTKIVFLDNGGLSIKTITVDDELHVRLHYNGNPIPLPKLFRKTKCKISSKGMLDNFSSHIDNAIEELGSEVLLELNRLRFYKPQGRPQYSNNVLKFALMQRYTSRQAYEMLLEELPLPSLSYLKSLAEGGVEPVQALKLKLEKEKVSSDCVLLLDEIHLQKDAEYHGGEMFGVDKEGELYTGVVSFMIVGLNKESILFVVKACPEHALTGEWIMAEIEETMQTMQDAGFNVRAVISDNYSTNVSAFKMLREKYGNKNDSLSFVFNGRKVYNLYDSVQTVKNIRNNLLGAKRFIFPEFRFDGFYDEINVDAGDLSWRLFHEVYERDLKLTANLQNAPKLNPKTLHPGNSKQNVP